MESKYDSGCSVFTENLITTLGPAHGTTIIQRNSIITLLKVHSHKERPRGPWPPVSCTGVTCRAMCLPTAWELPMGQSHKQMACQGCSSSVQKTLCLSNYYRTTAPKAGHRSHSRESDKVTALWLWGEGRKKNLQLILTWCDGVICNRLCQQQALWVLRESRHWYLRVLFIMWGQKDRTQTLREPLEVDRNMTSLIRRKEMQEDIKKDGWVNERMGGLTNQFMLMKKKMLCVPIFQIIVEDYSLPGSSLLL